MRRDETVKLMNEILQEQCRLNQLDLIEAYGASQYETGAASMRSRAAQETVKVNESERQNFENYMRGLRNFWLQWNEKLNHYYSDRAQEMFEVWLARASESSPTQPEKCSLCGSENRAVRLCEIPWAGGQSHEPIEGEDCILCSSDWHGAAATAPSAPTTNELPYWRCPRDESHVLSAKGYTESGGVPYCTVCPDRQFGVFRSKSWIEAAPLNSEPCMDCGRKNPVWFADNEVWNAVFPDRVGFVCPNCFIERADSIVRNTGWKLMPELAAPSAPQPEEICDTSIATHASADAADTGTTNGGENCCQICGKPKFDLRTSTIASGSVGKLHESQLAMRWYCVCVAAPSAPPKCPTCKSTLLSVRKHYEPYANSPGYMIVCADLWHKAAPSAPAALTICPICDRGVDRICDVLAVQIGAEWYHKPCSRFAPTATDWMRQAMQEICASRGDMGHDEFMAEGISIIAKYAGEHAGAESKKEPAV